MIDRDASGILYAWVAEHPEEGWTQIKGDLPEFGHRVVLTHRRYDIVTRPLWRAIALAHREASGQRVMLVRYTHAEVLEELP